MNLFVFDIETVPDVTGGQRLYDLQGLDAAETVKAMQHIRRQQTGGDDFLRPYLQQIVAISMVMRHGGTCRVWSLGNPDDDERELIRQFFGGISKYTPTLVSWNGSNFDLPVLHYRALLHSVAAPRYWEVGDNDREFRFNNYQSRYHWRHIDLMDVLAGFSPRATAPLDDIATLLGLPGKQGMDGSKVWDAYQAGEQLAIRHYCETDVLNTYLVYLRFELMRGHLDEPSYQQECQLLRQTLQAAQQPHLDAFLQAWAEST
jgi:predicted PolB exonuclease-like 3'-5' exonuclease